MLEFENVPVSVRRLEGKTVRLKLNVDPGSVGPQIVLLNVPPEDAREFAPGRRVRVTIEVIEDTVEVNPDPIAIATGATDEE